MESKANGNEVSNNTSTCEFERNNSVSSVPFIPRGNKVLIKMSYKNSIMGIEALYKKDTKFKQSDIDTVSYTIAGYGNLVNNINIGDSVLVATEPEIIVPISSNQKSINALGKQLDSLTSTEYRDLNVSTKWEVEEYGIFSEFQIEGLFM